MRYPRIVTAVLVVFTVACSDAPTASAPLSPDRPSLNGLGAGSGNAFGPQAPADASSDDETTSVAGDSASVGRGLGLGSGH